MTKDELINKTDKAIHELVYPKYQLQKAYNYYNGIRDKDQFKYLEEQFGTSTPTSINFTPLIKKHIDALVGEYLSIPIIPKVYCKDTDTLNNIDRERQLKINKELYDFLSQRIQKSILQFINKKTIDDQYVQQQMEALVNDINESFTSEYEIAAQNVIDYIMQSRDTDITTVIKTLILDLLITGYTFYKVKQTVSGDNIKIEALDPRNVFPDRNLESPYVKDSYRIVVRHWMSKEQIRNIYGDQLSKEDNELLEEKWDSIYDNSMHYIRMYKNKEGLPATDGILAGYEVTPGYPLTNYGNIELIPVYEVEWLETDKDFVMQRYETIRIGEEIYILKGKNESVIRSRSNPKYCSLSVNGVYFLNRSTEPYSLVLACAHLQDRLDLLLFYRDNLIANSGTVGDWIDETLIPAHLGVDMPTRLAKWIALKKQGLGLLNSSEEGRLQAGAAPLNTIFNGFDDTVKAQAIEAIQIAIDSIEQTASSITGVFRERLNGIEQRDAVTNIKIGQNNSFIITKQYYHQMDLVINEMLLDCLNQAKETYKNGLTGTIILGDKYQRVFTALPEYFTISDHDIRICTSSEVVKDLEQIKAIIPEFIKTGGLPPDLIIEAALCKSVPEVKRKVSKAMQIAKKENDQLKQASEQIQQLEDQLKQVTQQLKNAQSQLAAINKDKLQIEDSNNKERSKIEWYKAETERKYKEDMVLETKRRTDIELQQLYDGNPYNDKIRQT